MAAPISTMEQQDLYQKFQTFCNTPTWKSSPPQSVPPTEGVKHDAEKNRWDLLPFTELDDVVEVLTVGAKKYSPNNWKNVPDAKARYIAAALRHISARCQDEIYDREDGLSHTAHAICCLLFLSWFDRKDIDDELTP